MVIILFLVLLPTNNASGADLPQNKYLDAYNIINEGDKYFAKQEWALADENYILAMKMLKKLKAEYPNWEPSIVDYRLEYIRKKIKSPLKGEKDDEVKKPTEISDKNSKEVKEVMEIEVSSRLNMPFDEKEIVDVIPIKKGSEFKPEEVEQSKEILLATGKYKSVEIKEFEYRDERGKKGFKVVILIYPDIPDQDVEAYFEKSRRPENLTPQKAFWGQYGYGNQDNISIIPAEFDAAYPFIGSFAFVKKNGRYGFINSNGEIVLYLHFAVLLAFVSGLCGFLASYLVFRRRP